MLFFQHGLFLPAPKTGSTAIRTALATAWPEGAKSLDPPHGWTPPDDIDDRLVFTSARAPLSWYISWLTHAASNLQYRPDLFAWGNGRFDPAVIIENLLIPPLMEGPLPEGPGLFVDELNPRLREDLVEGASLWTASMSRYLEHAQAVLFQERLLEGLDVLYPQAIRFLFFLNDQGRKRKPLDSRIQPERWLDEVQGDEALVALIEEIDGPLATELGYIDGVPESPVLWLDDEARLRHRDEASDWTSTAANHQASVAGLLEKGQLWIGNTRERRYVLEVTEHGLEVLDDRGHLRSISKAAMDAWAIEHLATGTKALIPGARPQ